MGTIETFTIAENLSFAEKRGQTRTLKRALTKRKYTDYRPILATLEMNLENRLHERVEMLSGGQRQALSLIMATLASPEILLLDEHTAALDPKTAHKVLEITKQLAKEQGLTVLMITHNMEHAYSLGTRVIEMHEGNVSNKN